MLPLEAVERDVDFSRRLRYGHGARVLAHDHIPSARQSVTAAHPA